jgi:hypothetical protein
MKQPCFDRCFLRSGLSEHYILTYACLPYQFYLPAIAIFGVYFLKIYFRQYTNDCQLLSDVNTVAEDNE